MPKPRYESFVICTTPRSGSTLLCKMLAETGVTGYPDSHFHTPSVARWLETFALEDQKFASKKEALHAIFDAARVRGTAGTSIFGLRMQRGSFDYFIQQTSVLLPEIQSDVERIEAIFGPTLFIYLTRPNKLDQAISRVKAEQTGLWHLAANGTELERQSPPQEIRYDEAAISHHLNDLTKMDDAWRAWFKRNGLNPLVISYDVLSGDPQNVLGTIMRALELENNMPQNFQAPTAKLADHTSEIWANRYKNATRFSARKI